jgi:hypothetical protein
MKKYFLTPLLLSLLLGSIFVLPQRGSFAESSLISQVPLYLGEWSGIATPPSKKEKDTLAQDTEFNKAEYTCYDLPELHNAKGERFNSSVSLSIVKSGHDINNSIHRPERCLRAQGHLNLVSLPTSLTTPKGRNVKIEHITSQIPIAPAQEGDMPFTIGFVSYYYFVGHHQMTHSHWTRILSDMKDRLFEGTDQQWSFVMVSMPYNLGKDAADNKILEDQADKKIRQLLGELTDRLVKWNEIEKR